MSAFSTSQDADGILTITIDVSGEPVNVLNQAVIQEFNQLADEIDHNASIKAAILTSGKTDCFIAGADINMLQQVQSAAEGTAIVNNAHKTLQRIANSQKPFIAAINGTCLGAGYELSLACHYRIASSDNKTKIGLPEVMLGLLPGATGTTKLSRLIDLPQALDIMLTGKQLSAKRALKIGMIDSAVPPSILLDAAKKMAKQLINTGIRCHKPSLKQKLMRHPSIGKLILKKARQSVLKKTKGLYPAPLAILEVVEFGLENTLEKTLAYEAKRFGELTVTPEAQQLIHIYFATTELKKESFVSSEHQETTTINNVGILGGGLMGAGIATITIDKANTPVRMKEISDKGLLSAYKHIDHYYQTKVKRKILRPEQAKKKINQFSSTLDYSGFAQCDLIIEAVFEDKKIKQQMVKDIENLGNTNTIFASNTSSIPLADIAENAQRPENIIGMHYFSPVEKMPLLEIIKHSGTSDKTISSAVKFGKQQGKTVIVVNDGAGFYVNRILTPYVNAALELGLDGVAFDHIDHVLTQFGFPVGPIKLVDEVGIDIANKIQPILEHAFGERMQNSGVQTILLENKRLGKKVKKGFYQYTNKHSTEIDPSVYQELNITPNKTMASNDIIERCIYRMLNEAAICLEDKIINCPRDGDIGAIFGIGFPPFLGGPFRYMDTLGINTVVEKLQTFEKHYGAKYQAADLLISMAKDNRKFYEH